MDSPYWTLSTGSWHAQSLCEKAFVASIHQQWYYQVEKVRWCWLKVLEVRKRLDRSNIPNKRFTGHISARATRRGCPQVESKKALSICAKHSSQSESCHEISEGYAGMKFDSHFFSSQIAYHPQTYVLVSVKSLTIHSFGPSDHRPQAVHSNTTHRYRTTTNLFSLLGELNTRCFLLGLLL